MKIFLDIGHPAHVHYFRNLIDKMSERGHIFFVVARDKEVTHKLLKRYNINYVSRGKGGLGFWGKLLYLFKANYKLYGLAKKFKPDIFLSFASPYAAQVSYLMRKPHIAFNDTEHAKLGNLAFSYFSKVIITPSCFEKDFGEKHIRFKSYMELSYLHPKYFSPNPSILKFLKIKETQKFIVVRFVSWEASHDIGYSGLSNEEKRTLIKKLSKRYKVFISSESKLPHDLKKYQLNIPPEKIHQVLYYSSLFIGEGATMASESAMLGTPAIYVNILEAGTCNEQEKKYKLLYNFRNGEGVLEKAQNILNDYDQSIWKIRREILIKDKIDLTNFMMWFLVHFPNSIEAAKNNSRFEDFGHE